MANSREYEDLKKQLKEIGQRLDKFGGDASDHAKDIAGDKAQELKESLERIWSQLQDKKEEAWGKTRESAQKVNKYAEDNPWGVAMIAAAAGFIIGMISAKSRDKE